MSDVKIEVLENGPFIVEGPITITNYDGQQVPIPEGRTSVALCRCGGSVSKPFCDGMHSKIGFKGAMQAVEETDA